MVSDLIIFAESGKLGCKNKQGDIIIECKYDSIQYIDNEYILLKSSNTCSVVNYKGEIKKTFTDFYNSSFNCLVNHNLVYYIGTNWYSGADTIVTNLKGKGEKSCVNYSFFKNSKHFVIVTADSPTRSEYIYYDFQVYDEDWNVLFHNGDCNIGGSTWYEADISEFEDGILKASIDKDYTRFIDLNGKIICTLHIPSINISRGVNGIYLIKYKEAVKLFNVKEQTFTTFHKKDDEILALEQFKFDTKWVYSYTNKC